MFINRYQIAGISIRIESDNKRLYFDRSHFSQFRVGGNHQADISYLFNSIDADSLSLPPLSREEVARFSCYNSLLKDGWDTILLRSPLVRESLWARLDRPELIYLELRPSSIVLVDFASHEYAMFLTPEMGESLTGRIIGPMVLAYFLPIFSAVIAHSSGIVRNQRTALFLGPDEVGKTTVVRSAPDGTILCDDQVIIRKGLNGYEAHGTPWGVFTGEKHHARVGGFFILEQAEWFELAPLKPAALFQYLWEDQQGINHLLPKQLRKLAFEILSEVCQLAPVYQMRFPRDHIDWNLIDAAMR